MSEKEYNPHIVVYEIYGSWRVSEFTNKDDAIEEYEKLVQRSLRTVIIAELRRKHAEG